MTATAPTALTAPTPCTACGIALEVVRPRRSAPRWRHVATPPLPHVAETDAPVPAAASGSDCALFERLLDMEQEVRVTKVSEAFAPANLRDGEKADRSANASSAQARLFEAIAALTPEQAAAFGAYRLSQA